MSPTKECWRVASTAILQAAALCLCLSGLASWPPRACAQDAAVGAGIPPEGQDGLVDAETSTLPYVYRFWSPEYATYSYAAGEAAKETLLYEQGPLWLYDRVAWRASLTASDPNLRPVYRFWSDRLFTQYYAITGLWTEVPLDPWGDWQEDGIGFYAYPEGLQPAGAWPVYRLWSNSSACPFYTASSEEKDRLLGGECPVWTYGGIAWYVRPFDPAPVPKVVRGPYLLRPGADHMTVAWQTDLPGVGRLIYGQPSQPECAAQDPNVASLHIITLTGLEPDSPYLFRVTSCGQGGPQGGFRTAPKTDRSFRFVVYGDTRSLPEDHAAVMRGIVDSGPEVVFHVGDLVNTGGDYDSWSTEFFTPAAPIMNSVPMLPVAGNHEYWGSGSLWFPYLFNLPRTRPWWAMTYGPVQFIGLDSNLSYAPGSEQYQWLQAELASLASARALWRVVLLHHPPYTCSFAYSDDKRVKEFLVPLFEQYGVNVVFSGHTHAYERYWSKGITYIVTGGGGGPLYRLANDTVPPIREFGITVNHHCEVDADVTSRVLRLRAIDTEGKTFDTIEIGSTLAGTPSGQ